MECFIKQKNGVLCVKIPETMIGLRHSHRVGRMKVLFLLLFRFGGFHVKRRIKYDFLWKTKGKSCVTRGKSSFFTDEK